MGQCRRHSDFSPTSRRPHRVRRAGDISWRPARGCGMIRHCSTATARETSMLWRTVTIALALAMTGTALRAAENSPATAAGIEFFEKRIRPLLVEHCQQCHGAKQQRGGLSLASVAGMRQGGDRGPAIVPGQPEQSLLLTVVSYADDDLKMPPKGKLKAEQIADLTRWIELGAPGPPDSLAAPTPGEEFDLQKRRNHWA